MQGDAKNALKNLADEYGARSPEKLRQVARSLGQHPTLEQCKRALAENVPAQTLGPAPRSLGKSAAEAPYQRLQADLQDYSQNTHGKANEEHRYALQVSDVYTRKAYTEPLKTKSGPEVNAAMRSIMERIPGHAENAVLTTDAGAEFKGMDRVLPASGVHREKQGVNDIAVVDRTMQTLKRDLEARAQTKGTGWKQNLEKVTSDFNRRPLQGLHGSPNSADKEGPQQFMILQDQASNFQHNRHLTMSRKKAIEQAGGYREPIDNGGRSFKPNYGPVHQFKRFLPGGNVVDKRGYEALLKEVRPVSGSSAEPLGHITFNRKKEEAVRRKLSERALTPEPEVPKRRLIEREPSPPPPPPPPPPMQREPSPPRPLPPGPSHYTVAQLRRPDLISRQVMHGARASEAERAAQAAKKAAEAATKHEEKDAKLREQARKLQEKQLKQIDRMMKKG